MIELVAILIGGFLVFVIAMHTLGAIMDTVTTILAWLRG